MAESGAQHSHRALEGATAHGIGPGIEGTAASTLIADPALRPVWGPIGVEGGAPAMATEEEPCRCPACPRAGACAGEGGGAVDA